MTEKNIRILVVDDNQENLKVVSLYLKEKGFEIALAPDGNSALQILENYAIDLVLLDIMMPDMDGFEVCSRIKVRKEWKSIPIIFLTAKIESENIIKGFQTGGIDYITKPVRKEELYTKINHHVKIKLIRNLVEEYNNDDPVSADAMVILRELENIIGSQI